VRDKEHPRQPKKFEDFELQELLHENPAETLLQLSKTLNVTSRAVLQRLYVIRFIRKGYSYHISCQKLPF